MVVSAAALLLNVRVRLTSFLLGMSLLISVVASKAYYGNNKTFCGLMLVLASLHQPGRSPWMLRLQLVVVYFGAGLNKTAGPGLAQRGIHAQLGGEPAASTAVSCPGAVAAGAGARKIDELADDCHGVGAERGPPGPASLSPGNLARAFFCTRGCCCLRAAPLRCSSMA